MSDDTKKPAPVASDPLLPADHPLAARPRPADSVGLVREPFVPSAKAAAETVEVLRLAELEARAPDFAADALALTLAAEQSIRNWLRAHGHDPDARPWDETVIALLEAPPVGSVAGLLAKVEARESEERGKGTRYPRGDPDGDLFAAAADAFGEAASLARSTLAAPADAVGKVVAEVMAKLPSVTDDGEPWSANMHYWEGVAPVVESIPEDEAPTRENLIDIVAEALAGILACDAAKGGSHV